MVVRDEEMCCGMTIETVKDYIDEIVLVDHSSNDMTVDIITQRCKKHKIPLHKFTMKHNHTLVDLRAKALVEAAKLNPDWFFIIDGDMVFNTNDINIRRIIRGYPYEQYWFNTLNIYGDMNHYDGINIPHLWLFKNVKTIYATASYLCPFHLRSPKTPFLGWNLSGIKSIDHLFRRYQLWFSRAWNRGHKTNLGVDDFINRYFDGSPTTDYINRFVLNRLRVRAASLENTAFSTDLTNPMDGFGITTAEFKKRYLNFPDGLKNWDCPFELLFDANKEIIGREPDLLGVPVRNNEGIFQLKKETLNRFREYNAKPFTPHDLLKAVVDGKAVIT